MPVFVSSILQIPLGSIVDVVINNDTGEHPVSVDQSGRVREGPFERTQTVGYVVC